MDLQKTREWLEPCGVAPYAAQDRSPSPVNVLHLSQQLGTAIGLVQLSEMDAWATVVQEWDTAFARVALSIAKAIRAAALDVLDSQRSYPELSLPELTNHVQELLHDGSNLDKEVEQIVSHFCTALLQPTLGTSTAVTHPYPSLYAFQRCTFHAVNNFRDPSSSKERNPKIVSLDTVGEVAATVREVLVKGNRSWVDVVRSPSSLKT